MGTPKVAVLVVTWNAVRDQHADRLIASLRAVDYPAADWTLFVGDNASVDGTADHFAAECPGATVVRFPENLGFAEANNRLAARALEAGYTYAYLLNQDCAVDPGFLSAAVAMIESDSTIAVVQSRLLLLQSPERLNSIGNAIHFLGFGFSLGSGERTADFSREAWNGREIAYASGAGMLVRLDVVRRIGLFEPTFFLYHEDLDFGWQVRLVGMRCVTAYDSIVYHHYAFSKSPRKFYWLERNRFLVLLENLQVGTLLLLSPAFIAFELGLLVHAHAAGFLGAKLDVYREFGRWSTWRGLLARRKRKQRRRTVSDGGIFALHRGVIENPEIDGWLLRRVANPCFALYFAIVRRFFVF